MAVRYVQNPTPKNSKRELKVARIYGVSADGAEARPKTGSNHNKLNGDVSGLSVY